MRRTSHHLIARRAAALAVTALLGLSGCSSSRATGPVPDPLPIPSTEPVASGDGAAPFPSYTLRDLVTYGDHAVVLTVVASEALEFEQLHPSGAGRTGRKIELRVDDVLWSNTDAPRLPDSFEIRTLGWVRNGHSGGDTRMTMGRPWLLDGHTYFAMLYTLNGPGVPTLSIGPTGALLPMDGGVIGQGEYLGAAPPVQYEAVTQLNGATGEQAARLLSGTSPDRRAAPYMDLPADDRYTMVAEGKLPGTDPVFPPAVPAPSAS